MSGDSIFLLSDDGDDPFVELRAAPYDSEDVLQRLLGEHPDLLAGGQMNVLVPRRWLLISRELGVPKQEAGAGWWSLDHLFVDQDGIPTFVEVKRSSNTEIRRHVVGQMLDYAANGTRYWPILMIQSSFEAHCESAGVDPAAVLSAHLGEGAGPEAFWASVAEHLQAGKVRMVFVADMIPPELQRIIEFLNEHMAAIDVLGVEVRQYVGPGRRTSSLASSALPAQRSRPRRLVRGQGTQSCSPTPRTQSAILSGASWPGRIHKGSQRGSRLLRDSSSPQTGAASSSCTPGTRSSRSRSSHCASAAIPRPLKTSSNA